MVHATIELDDLVVQTIESSLELLKPAGESGNLAMDILEPCCHLGRPLTETREALRQVRKPRFDLTVPGRHLLVQIL
jgi:hypothetical protein